MHNNAMNVESDRLSSLADDIIHIILSFISIKDSIGTSVLSSRWRFIWTSMPHLNFENLNHRNISKLISNVMSHRNNEIQVSSVNLVLGRTFLDDESVKSILICASFYNVRQLTVTRSPGNLVGHPLYYGWSVITTPTLDLPALTTLHLHHINISDNNDATGTYIGLFSKCTNLKNLYLRRCMLVKGTKVLKICNPCLCNLTLEYILPNMELEEYVSVDAPQLKNLTIKWCKGKHLINAPGLASLVIEGSHPWIISTTGFPSLENVDLSLYSPSDADSHKIVSLLQQFRSAKLLILSLGILKSLSQQWKHLSSSMELIQHEACAFANAKIIKFTTKFPVKVYLEVQSQDKVTTTPKIKNYDTSPGAIFPMVSREELKAMGEMASAQLFVENLGRLLKECRADTNSDINNTHVDEHGKPQVKKQWAWEVKLNLREMMELIKQSNFVAFKIGLMMANFKPSISEKLEVIAWLQERCSLFVRIENLMIQLSASERALMQPKFSSLCEDAAILTNNILDWMKTITLLKVYTRRNEHL